jgi:hypothetical protein
MNYWIGILGTILVEDGLLSLMLYMRQPSFDGRQQNWRLDHWVRARRIIIGIVLIVIGWRGI